MVLKKQIKSSDSIELFADRGKLQKSINSA